MLSDLHFLCCSAPKDGTLTQAKRSGLSNREVILILTLAAGWSISLLYWTELCFSKLLRTLVNVRSPISSLHWDPNNAF